MRKYRGATLAELLVVMSIWSFLMVAILGFYAYGTKVSTRYDKASQEIRVVQLLADKINTFGRNAYILEVIQFPPTLLVQRIQENPLQPDCLLANLRPTMEFLCIGPDPKRTPPEETPMTSAYNAVLTGIYGQPGEVSLPLPRGMRAEFRLTNGILILSCNNPLEGQPLGLPPLAELPARRPEDRLPLNHFFEFRGLSPTTRYMGN
ncbi:MAG: type II secretion system protein [Candidatus Eremiobacteraeota bacterium]|nr:type II secretion system protein [Candidatus Eremiobacteraeota bacterium]MCW5867689.1 type II secretion system protein [Candidatus Eremiobacteraeota bacterium]